MALSAVSSEKGEGERVAVTAGAAARARMIRLVMSGSFPFGPRLRPGLRARDEAKKNGPAFLPKTGSSRFKKGLLTSGSISSRAFQAALPACGVLRDSSPVTVAGAVAAPHGPP